MNQNNKDYKFSKKLAKYCENFLKFGIKIDLKMSKDIATLADDFLICSGIITPFSQQFIKKQYLESFNTTIKLERIKENMSLPAKSFALIIENSYLRGDIWKLKTKKNVLKEYEYEVDDMKSSIIKKEFIKLVNNEIEFSEYTTESYPLYYLAKGILFNNNHRFLSHSDTIKFSKLYGIDLKMNDMRKAVAQIISIQNGILRELLQNGYDYNVKGHRHVVDLIQPEYDPENMDY